MKTLRLFLIMVLLLMVSSCSRIKFAYNQLNWALPYYFETYMALSNEQRSFLDQQVEMILAWHCASELSNYAAIFREVNADFQTGRMSRERIAYYAQQIELFWFEIMHQTSPIIIRLLRTAKDDQLNELFQNLDEKNREWLNDFKDQTIMELQEEYLERMNAELERWFGPLHDQQKQALASWVKAFQPLGIAGYQTRKKWQMTLRQLTLNRNDKVAFKLGIEQLLLKPKLLRTAAYQKMLDNNRSTTIELLYLIGKQLDQAQRKHLSVKIKSVAQDFDELACTEDSLERQETAELSVDYP